MVTDLATHTNGKKNLIQITELVKYFPVRGGCLGTGGGQYKFQYS
jgi:hypothetical protein